MLSEKITAHWL